MTHAAKRGRALVRPESSPRPEGPSGAARARGETHFSQLRTVDHSVRGSMKNAANCAKHGELQGFMKPLHVERILRPWLAGQGRTHLRVERNPFSRTSRGARRLPTGRAGLRAGFRLNASAGEAALPLRRVGGPPRPRREARLSPVSLSARPASKLSERGAPDSGRFPAPLAGRRRRAGARGRLMLARRSATRFKGALLRRLRAASGTWRGTREPAPREPRRLRALFSDFDLRLGKVTRRI